MKKRIVPDHFISLYYEIVLRRNKGKGIESQPYTFIRPPFIPSDRKFRTIRSPSRVTPRRQLLCEPTRLNGYEKTCFNRGR